jgi:hypothetical protein
MVDEECQMKREYDDICFQFRFACVGDSSARHEQCALCYQTLATHMFPVKLQEHLYRKHSDCKYIPLHFLRGNCEELKQSNSDLTSVIRDESGNVCELSHC